MASTLLGNSGNVLGRELSARGLPNLVMKKLCLIPFGALCFLVACKDTPRQESPEVRFEREAAYRQACVARALAQRATDDLQILTAATESFTLGDSASILSRDATNAAVEFARAFQRHAEFRLGAYAYLDSAVNHSTSAADSVRYLERASSFSIRSPEQGTVEANVLESYQQKIADMLADQNNQCNWDIPF
jgi:hypothetical protein